MKGDKDTVIKTLSSFHINPQYLLQETTHPQARSVLEEGRNWGKGKTLKSTQMHHF